MWPLQSGVFLFQPQETNSGNNFGFRHASTVSEHTTNELNSSAAALLGYLRRPAILLSAVALIIFFLYISTLSFEFVWDDHVQVESNPLVLSWKAVPRAFHSSLWFPMTPDGKGNYYRPFFTIWSVLNHSLFGFRPWGWHLTNVLLHILASCLLFVLLRRMQVEYWAAAIATLVFAVHPVHIEPVAWVSAGADTLATALYLLTFLAYLQSREDNGRWRIGWSLVSWSLFACALLTKEMVVTFPVILALYLWFCCAETPQPGVIRRIGKILGASLPYVVLNVLYLAERTRVLHSFSQTQKNYGPLVTLITLPKVLINYMRILIFPGGLTGFYYTPYVRDINFASFILPALGLALIALFVYWWSRRERDPLITFFGIWIPICLAPVLYLPAFKNGDFVRDRYIYLPSVGFAYLLAKAIRKIPLRLPGSTTPWLQPAAVALMSGACAFGVLTQQVYWAEDLLVFHRGYTLYPQNTAAVKNLAYAFNQSGDPASAMSLLQQALTADPDDYFSHWVLAVVDSQFHQDEQAKQELSKAVSLNPQYFLETPHGLTNLGIAFANAHEYDRAENCLRRALEIQPDASPALVYMGLVLLRTNRTADAETYLQKAAAIDAEGYDVNWGLGVLAQIRGDRALAERLFSEELRFHPDNRGARLALAALSTGNK